MKYEKIVKNLIKHNFLEVESNNRITYLDIDK